MFLSRKIKTSWSLFGWRTVRERENLASRSLSTGLAVCMKSRVRLCFSELGIYRHSLSLATGSYNCQLLNGLIAPANILAEKEPHRGDGGSNGAREQLKQDCIIEYQNDYKRRLSSSRSRVFSKDFFGFFLSIKESDAVTVALPERIVRGLPYYINGKFETRQSTKISRWIKRILQRTIVE